ncbi:MAG TPA: (E)-4-hydroxy-3-methylbut-2-enyl-diphosphate synthase [Taishania sp.]|nr:(E)-4-hydroxy-3-methylbut-2-enyl-diphosphate synthase [Taishania sp.]
MAKNSSYCINILGYQRFKTRSVTVGKIGVGGENPIRVQSMTTADTMNTEASIEESIRMIDAGCEIVRLTAPSKKEAENLKLIKQGLVARGYDTPLVADIHFTPNAAEVAADYVEKIRVNPGNYADKKKFEEIDYTEESYQKELHRIEEKFTPLVLKCKDLGRAMRIGTNHGSLSDRILSRYGDTPEGMVESAMEFIRICEKNDYRDLVISMKASNALVMVQAYRLLVATMLENGQNYPLHLGVTEAGDGEDGRIKSAVGIGALLEDGLGDTIRVSLTENPEYEIPVARKLLQKFDGLEDQHITSEIALTYSPFSYQRRKTSHISNVGSGHVPVVVADLSKRVDITPANFFGFGYSYSMQLDKWNLMDLAADIVYIGSNTIDFEVPGTVHLLQDFAVWNASKGAKYVPFVPFEKRDEIDQNQVHFLQIDLDQVFEYELLKNRPNAIFVVQTTQQHKTPLLRKLRLELDYLKIENPVILKANYETTDEETFQLHASSDLGIHFIDGFGDGVWITGEHSLQVINSLSFGILQATRTRISKTEYISCPSCGRTLFDLQETTAKIRAKTSHLKGIKIGIMGCIVNGPGEMADADYGYVGTGPGKINLYKEKTVVRKNVPEDEAVDALIQLITEHGDWIDPKAN